MRRQSALKMDILASLSICAPFFMLGKRHIEAGAETICGELNIKKMLSQDGGKLPSARHLESCTQP